MKLASLSLYAFFERKNQKQRLIYKRFKKLVAASTLVLLAVVAHGQIPPAIKHPQIVLYGQAQNQTNGAATDWSDGEIVLPIGLASSMTCSNNLLPGWWTVFGWGRISHTHTQTNYWGTNSAMSWPVPIPPQITTFDYAGFKLLSVTNTFANNPPSEYFKVVVSTNGYLVTIFSSSNLITWSRCMVQMTTGYFNITSYATTNRLE